MVIMFCGRQAIISHNIAFTMSTSISLSEWHPLNRADVECCRRHALTSRYACDSLATAHTHKSQPPLEELSTNDDASHAMQKHTALPLLVKLCVYNSWSCRPNYQPHEIFAMSSDTQRRIEVFLDFIRSGERDQRLLELDEGESCRVSNWHLHSAYAKCYCAVIMLAW